MTILDATSGNTGIAYAMIGAARGYKVKICLPRNASSERKRILLSYGAEIVETDPLLSTDGAQLCAREIFESARDAYFTLTSTTIPRIGWRIMKLRHRRFGANEQRITHFVAGLGTSAPLSALFVS